MKHRTLLALAVTAACVSLSLATARAADEPTRPNILYIMSDDHAAHALSCYGSKVNKTPQLDRIAEEGMRFENCFCTNSICGPCRAVVLTGKYSHLNGFIDNRSKFDGTQQTVAKLLQKAGYETAMVGKWHLVTDPTGFDYWHILLGQGPYYNPPMKTPDGIVKHTGYTTDIIADEVLDFLKNKRDKSKPFFVMYHNKAPHRNWQPGPKYLSKYDDVTLPEPLNLLDDYSGRGTAARVQEMTIAKHLNPHDLKLAPQGGFTPEQEAAWNKAYGPKNEAFEKANLQGDDLVRWKYQRYMKDYIRCIDSVDENVGRVLDYLAESGLDKTTVVLYTSDQGFYLGDHGWFDKRFIYEESLRSPLLVRWPGHTKPGSVNKDIVLNLDFAETFLGIAGQPVPDDMQGKSLVPILNGETPDDWREAMYYRYYEYPAVHMVNKHYGIRTERYTLVYFHELDEWELYDLEKDPHQMKSVYDDPAYADVVKELKAELVRLKEHYKDDDTVVGKKSPDPKKVKLQKVLQFDFGKVNGEQVVDGSGNGLDGTLAKGEVVEGRNGKALQLDGKTRIALPKTPEILSPAFRPMLVGAWCKPAAADGVVAAMGGEALGFSLYLKEGVPQFAVRSSGNLSTVAAPKAVELSEWVHLAGAIDANGKLWIFVDGRPVADAAGAVIPDTPSDILTIGADAGPLVGQYDGNNGYHGLLEDVRLYWGQLPKKEMQAWAQ